MVGSFLVSEDEIYHPMIFWLLGIVTRDQIFFFCCFCLRVGVDIYSFFIILYLLCTFIN